MTSSLVPAPQPATTPDSTESARRDLLVAREHLAQSLESFEGAASSLNRLRALVRTRPGLALGGAFLVGYGLARLLRRR